MVTELLKLLKSFTEQEIALLESKDRQYRALKKLFSAIKEPELFLKLVVVNALLSYQLQMKGEDYWETFSRFFSKSPKLENFEEFLKLYNKRFLPAKLKRLKKVIRCIEKITEEKSILAFGNNLKELVRELSSCLNQKEDSKTIVFAAKMFMYGYRIAFGEEPKGADEIGIPLDSRLSKINPDKRFWEELSEKSGIPQIHLDAVFWIPAGMKEEEMKELPENLREKLEKLQQILSSG
ncbi:N-glycosylase/DNA lyase [Phorcysia thermohydrogeniphila]|uniref:DNA-(Apurinic or apyrimidinic site) lyase n=1 Tax=Phorcysia thermohydrogeniphila TaxID=936138 RepID=A0A4R1GE48_9BACT|nr:N-glycosylase/DNA lyase [Phorcysia thermohydrogeniphila]TCK04009.1 DNA-(apurinic or apyrimidinic site) lyase [Phorcysia thermohydrogeniphila]